MRFIGDFHIHSPYSRATSRQLTPENLDLWGRIKGIRLIGTGDFTHPGWTAELAEKLTPAEEGLFTLKAEYRRSFESAGLKQGASDKTRFMLTAEISSIYKFDGRVRKVHNLVMAPGFEAAYKIQEKIERLGGNIRSDGRPILGLDSRDLLELCLEADGEILFVPAHIWTPWFSALGSKSGFDSIRDCFRDLAEYIYAVETGLSSDPPMNWMCSFLDEYTLISNSDAHSPEKLGREACIFETELAYPDVIGAIKKGASGGFRGTVEFFPQEGKYHFDGHRKCSVCWDPLETALHGGICPECGRPVTVGVLNRVAQLADRKNPEERKTRDPFYSLIPLKELLAELEGVGAGSKRVHGRYLQVLNRIGPEFDVLLHTPLEKIERSGGPALAETIGRMRRRQVQANPGYDGEYGSIRIWDGRRRPPTDAGEGSLFEPATAGRTDEISPLGLIEFDLAAFQEEKQRSPEQSTDTAAESREHPRKQQGLNPGQEAAAAFTGGSSLVIAGPGTGKTRTVVEKICRLIAAGVSPEGILAVTFANKAAGELRERLSAAGIAACASLAGSETDRGKARVFTFHSLGLEILRPRLNLLGRSEEFLILDDDEKNLLLTETVSSAADRKNLIARVSAIKNGVVPIPGTEDTGFRQLRAYQQTLKMHDCFDYDDLVYLPVRLFEKRPEILKELQAAVSHIIVDEYQDINPVQYALLRSLAGGECSVCAVGDPNQSIYSFRGGSPEFIRRFSLDFPEARTFTLSRSYRCPGTVLAASSQVLGTGETGVSGERRGLKISLVTTGTAASEAEQIARDIEARSGGMGFFSFDSEVSGPGTSGDTALSDIAVLCRTTLQMPPLQKAFRDHRIPFRTIRAESLFNREPYRSFLNFVRFLSRRDRPGTGVIGAVQKIDRMTMETIPLPSSRQEWIARFTELYFADSAQEPREEMERELFPYWNDGDGVREFTEKARLGTGPDSYDPRMQAVTLMTIHAAKGLEFGTVYIPGCEDSLLPCTLSRSSRDEDTAGNIEEEKRLLYVAMTRTKQDLILSCAGNRTIFGKTVRQKESPFLAAIDNALVERREIILEGKKNPEQDQLSLFG